MRARLLGGAIAGAAVLAAPASARRLVLFPTPATPLSTPPPLAGAELSFRNLFRPPLDSHERIDVGLDGRGAVVSVAVTQRLALRQTGDYRITIAAPVRDVEPAPGTDSPPGQRQGALLWQGFASGRKILAARARLDPATAARALPLRVGISALVDGRPLEKSPRSGPYDVSVRLHNSTRVSVTTFSGEGDRPTLAKILDALRDDPSGRSLGQTTYVPVNGSTGVAQIAVEAPLRVVGRLRFGTGRALRGSTTFSAVLGGGQPLDRLVHLRGRALGIEAPQLELIVAPAVPAKELRPPGRSSWAEAIRLQRRLNGRRLLAHALKTSLTLARIRQYQTYLANPDPLGKATARYVYRTASRPAAAPLRPPADDGLGGGAIALITALAVLGTAGLVVLWAHS